MKNFKLYFSTKNAIKESICKSCALKQLDNKIICGICSTIREIRPMDYIKSKDYFSIFNINSKFQINEQELDYNYKELQKFVHPDKYSTTNNDDIINEAHICSALISNAYSILKDDYKRANYLIKLKGYEGIEENSKNVYDKNLLENLMEIQERIEECNSRDELLLIQIQIQNELDEYKQKLQKSFDIDDMNTALECLKLIKFNLNILEQIDTQIFRVRSRE
jgi:molecular chaperone HscB